MTNYERIKNLTVEEMTDFLIKCGDDAVTVHEDNFDEGFDRDFMLNWLKEEYRPEINENQF